MATLEQVERLREKASVSFEDAKAALDASGGDLLDALIWLEKQGKVKPPASGGYYSSRYSGEGGKDERREESASTERQGESFSEMMRRFGRFCLKLINKGNSNYFEVKKDGRLLLSVPVTVLVIASVFAFWIVLPLMILGLFLGCRYHFRGEDLGKESVNRVMDSASEAAENIKKSFNSEK